MQKEILLHTVFEKTARKFPDNIAIEIPCDSINKVGYKFSYREINEKARAQKTK